MLSADQLLLVLWKRKLTFLLTLLLVLAGTAAVTFTMEKVYEANTYLLVASGRNAGSDFEATQTNQVLSKTYAELLQTRNTAEAVAERLPFDARPDGLQAAVEIEQISQSQLILIHAEADSPERAKTIADTYATTFVDRVGTAGVAGGGNVEVAVAEPAVLEPSPVRPRPKLYLAVGFLLGCFAGAAAAFLRNRLDQRLELTSATTEVLGLPVLGRIPQRPASPDRLDPRLADAFRLVLANVSFANLGARPRTLTVVSAGEAEGKSTSALNLARSAVELGARVLLVDGDLRRPGLTKMLGARADSGAAGFSSLLLAPERTPAALDALDGEQPAVVGAGPIPPNPAALLGADGLARFEAEAKERFDLVVFDTPPLLVGADASLIAARTEGVVLVLDARRTRRTSLTQAVDQLRRTGSNILGVVVNKSAESGTDYYYAAAGDEGAEARARDDAEAFSATRE